MLIAAKGQVESKQNFYWHTHIHVFHPNNFFDCFSTGKYDNIRKEHDRGICFHVARHLFIDIYIYIDIISFRFHTICPCA